MNFTDQSSETFLIKLDEWAYIHPERRMYTYLDEDLDETETYTYLEFKSVTDNLAYYLVDKFRFRQGNGRKKILLVYPTGTDFLVSFVACMKARMIPISVYPPNPHYLKKDLIQFSNIVKQCEVTDVLTNSEYYKASMMGTIKSFFGITWPKLNWIQTDKLYGKQLRAYQDKWISPLIKLDDIAFIQCTSGTITNPTPLEVTHGNLLHNLITIKKTLFLEYSINVSWLPQYHDFGLLGARLCPVYYGGTSIFMSPFSFIRSPNAFLHICAKYHATHIQGPNFMYRFMARKWRELECPPMIDLSSLYHIFNAAEPINVEDYQYFYQTFQKYGLKKAALATGYGLAESVVYVCDTGRDSERGSGHLLVNEKAFNLGQVIIEEDPEQGKLIANCGKSPPGSGVEIRIYHDGSVLSELKIGEIIVSSDSVVEQCRTLEIDEERYVPTGDLGFMYRGELFVTGRLKDMLIISGKNYYPQDFEWIIDRNSSIRGGSTAVFEKDGKIVAVTEVKPEVKKSEYSSLVESLKTDIRMVFSLGISIYLVKKGSVIKTTSGKVSRGKCRDGLGGMRVVFRR
jgi:acyl-CoA synthetase (AMP-forming)/AMP-acid ligase II